MNFSAESRAKRIVIRAHKDPFRIATADKTLGKNLIGNNVGNLIFSQASYRLLSHHETKVRRYRGQSAWLLNQTADAFVIPLANAFRKAFVEPLNSLATLVEDLKIPVVVLGVGAQSGRDGSPEVRDAAKRFVAAVLDHSAKIGVRGEYTKSYIESLGFAPENIEVIGCPSMFMHGNQIRVVKKVEQIEENSQIAFNLSPYRKKMAPIANANLARYPNLTYFAQDLETLRVMRGGEFIGKDRPGMPIPRNHPLLAQDKTVFPLDPKTWFEELAKREFTFGSRIHGTIASIIAGTPELLLAHDSRTTELADYHRLPYRQLSEVADDVLARDLYEFANYEQMFAQHQENYERMIGFIELNGLQPATLEDNAAFDDRIAAKKYPPIVRVKS